MTDFPTKVPNFREYTWWTAKWLEKLGQPSTYAPEVYAIRNSATGGWLTSNGRLSTFVTVGRAKSEITINNLGGAELVKFSPDGNVLSREQYAPACGKDRRFYSDNPQEDWGVVVEGF